MKVSPRLANPPCFPEGAVVVQVFYGPDNPIWRLNRDKQDRKALAHAQRALIIEADKLAKIKIDERG